MTYKLCILTFNAEKHIKKLISSFNKNQLGNVLIVDSSSTDNTVSIAEGFGVEIKIIDSADFDHGGTRAMAAQMVDSDFLIFMTQDALPVNSDAIDKLIQPMIDDNKIGAVYGRQLPYEHTNVFGKHLRLFNYKENSYVRELKDKAKFGFKTAFLSNSFSAYRLSALEEIGWFKSNLIFGEDAYAGAKLLLAGYKLAYVADAQVYHSHSYSALGEFKRYFDMGVFHKTENWLLKEFGKPEGEGKKYVISEFKFLINNKKFHLIPSFFIRNGMKFLGYKMGMNYRFLPKFLVKKISMSKTYWEKDS